MTLHKDLSEFVELFRSRNIEFTVVGAFVLAHHGLPRSTGYIDLLIRATQKAPGR